MQKLRSADCPVTTSGAPSAAHHCRISRWARLCWSPCVSSPEGTVETGEPLYEQDLEENRIDAMSQGATTAAMLLFAIPIAGFVLAAVWSFGGTQDPARRRLARAYLIRALVVAGLVILFVAVAAMVFTAALHSQLAYYYYR